MALRVLVVDDAADVRLLIRYNFRNQRCEVIGEAADGRAAIELARDLRPDAVVLDLSMPVMSGFEALPEIKLVSPETRVLVLTASGRDTGELAREAGADDVMYKGEPLEEICPRLHALCLVA